ncbi:MAG: FIST N-terminal domain-containing protein [Candidatus Spechtbacterales bacterium]
MAIYSGIGSSTNIQDPVAAGKEAVLSAISELGKEPHIIFAFSSVKFDQEKLVLGMNEARGDATLVGGSAAGEITSYATTFESVIAMAIHAENTKFTVGYGEGTGADSHKAGADAAKAVLGAAGGKISLFIMIPEGLTGNGSAIVRGVQSVLGVNFPLMGGSAGDDYLFKKTWQYYNDKLLTDCVIGIGLSGDFAYGFGVRHGWEPVGLPLKVTKSEGAVLKELDGKPALKVYQDYFGKDAEELIREPIARMAYTYPLGMSVEGSNELLIRDPVIASEEGEITLAGEIPEGTTIRLMIGDRDKAIAAAKDAAQTALSQLEGTKPEVIIMFNCMARNRLLGVRCHEENEAVQNVLGSAAKMIGLYTYGEQGPLLGKKGTPAYFHNETMTLLVLGEK